MKRTRTIEGPITKKPKTSSLPTIGTGDWTIIGVVKTKNPSAASTVELTFNNNQKATYTLEKNRQTNERGKLKRREQRYHSGLFSVIKKMVPQCDMATAIGPLAWTTPLLLKEGNYVSLSTEYANIKKVNSTSFFKGQRDNNRPFIIMKYYGGVELYTRQVQACVNASSSYEFTNHNLHVNINLCINFLIKANILLQQKSFCDFKPENVMVSEDEKTINIIDYEGFTASVEFIPPFLRQHPNLIRELIVYVKSTNDSRLLANEKLRIDSLIKLIDQYAALRTALEFFIPFIDAFYAMNIIDSLANISTAQQLQQSEIENALVHPKAQKMKKMLIEILKAFGQQFLSIQDPFFDDSLSSLTTTLTQIATRLSSARSTPECPPLASPPAGPAAPVVP